ncbi:ranBP-type and C3HC4-type zinc finger-containing protein 1-like [Malaya genurostris]|uniref:ranBP-type and C3HC4-type zinc finger-containing protein 1-like n=1 Tax=Malaya genurostris TaxID=325434 RepID=UPI0026F3C803|nr:ranBP-type and C3HC4-type zinc finger-containing protein 1-like [Malaya genurostris]
MAKNNTQVEGTNLGQYEQLLELSKQSLVLNNNETECNLCAKMTAPAKGIVLANCLHTYCRTCIRQSLLQATSERCPYPHGRYECDGVLSDQEIKSLLSSEEEKCFLERVFGAMQIDTVEPSKAIDAEDFDLLVTLSDASIVPNLQSFECPICFELFKAYEGVILRECFHKFCKQCLQNSIVFSEDVEVRCPFQENGNACENVIEHREIKSLLDERNYDIFLNRSLKQAESLAENAFHCKTPDCNGWCLVETTASAFQCSICRATNCLRCKAIHSNMNCEDYQDVLSGNYENRRSERTLQSLVETGEAMHCPNCRMIITKITGCDFLTCSMCKTGICWATRGFRWGPLGCGCGKDGRKCHPSCTNCH